MLKRASLLLVVIVLALGRTAPAWGQAKSFLRSDPKFVEIFRNVVATPNQSTVRILCDDKETALGMVVAEDGWILTKANDLKGAIAVKLRDGAVYEAKLIGVHKEHDLAVLKIEATGLKPVNFRDSKDVAVGSWVACAGIDSNPVGIGIVSVATRKVANKGPIVTQDLSKAGYLGVGVEQGEGGVRINNVMANTAAAKAGVKVKDLVLALDGEKMSEPDQFIAAMAKHKPGDVVKLSIRRGDEDLEIEATLGKRPLDMLRGDIQNKMGSELSSRRSGYPTILQHDSVVKPADCGGPIVDLDGKVIGINICRAGRTESWAVPSEVIQSLLPQLMSGNLAPPKTEQPAPEKK